jgi:type II secretory pathway component PulJ
MDAPQKNEHPWEWFTDRVLHSLIVALCLALGGGMWMTYQSVVNIGHILDRQQREIEALRARISHVETSLVTKSDLLETMKRVEQQLEIMMLRAGMRPMRITE